MGKCRVPPLVSIARSGMVMEILMWYCSLMYQGRDCSLLSSSVVKENPCSVSGGLLGYAGEVLLCLPVGKGSLLGNGSEACIDDYKLDNNL